MSPRRSLTAMQGVFLLTLETLFWSRKTVLMVLMGLLILGGALWARLALSHGILPSSWSPSGIFEFWMTTGVIRLQVLLTALFYGTALVSDEVEGKTLTYLLVRPISKIRILIVKYLSLLWMGIFMLAPTLIGSYGILFWNGSAGSLLEHVRDLSLFLGAAGLALYCYGALFTFLGTCTRHAFLLGLLYAFGWEGIAGYLPGLTRTWTLAHHVQSILPRGGSSGLPPGVPGSDGGVVTLLLLGSFFLALACLVFREREYVLKQ